MQYYHNLTENSVDKFLKTKGKHNTISKRLRFALSEYLLTNSFKNEYIFSFFPLRKTKMKSQN